MNNQFTQRVSDVIQFSKEEANRLRNKSIQPEHLLLGLIREGEGKAVRILQSLYVDLQKIKQTLEDELRLQADMSDTYSEDITFDSQASRILKMSILEARVLKSPATDTEHMLLAYPPPQSRSWKSELYPRPSADHPYQATKAG